MRVVGVVGGNGPARAHGSELGLSDGKQVGVPEPLRRQS